jgi:N-acetyl-anhydromuramyl-L-alanine amidase AmpD
LGLFVLIALGARAEATDEPTITWHAADPANFTEESSRTIDMVVIHKAEGSAESAWSTFQDPTAQRSAHYVVGSDGSVSQMVSDKNIAWHAGNWSYNVRSIGIENAGYTYRDDMTTVQMHSLAQLVAHLCEKYGIPEDRNHIIGHDEVPDPNDPSQMGGINHHTDPGPYFDWTGFMKQVKGFTGAKSSTKPAATTSARPALQTTADVNVRDAAWGNILGVAPSGTTFVGTGGESQGFSEIWFAGRKAFISSSYLEGVSAHGAKVVAKETKARTNKKSDPSNVLGEALQGQVYVSLGVDPTGTWRKIQFSTRHAWVLRSDTQAAKLAAPSGGAPYTGSDPVVQAVMQWKSEIVAASKKYGVAPEIIAAVIERESDGQNVISDGGHGHGLMSIDDRSWGDWLASHDDGLDPASNIDEGTAILRSDIDYFGGDVHEGLNGYNAGPGAGGGDWATTDHNYGSDVLAKSAKYKGLF